MGVSIVVITDFERNYWVDFIRTYKDKATVILSIATDEHYNERIETATLTKIEKFIVLIFEFGNDKTVVLVRQQDSNTRNQQDSNTRNKKIIRKIINEWIKGTDQIAICAHGSGGTLSDAKGNFPQVEFYETFHHVPDNQVWQNIQKLFNKITDGQSFNEFWKFMESRPGDFAKRPSLFEHLTALDILVQGYLAAIYLGKGALTMKEVEQVFEALKTNKGLRSREELSREASKGELAPFRLVRPLCVRSRIVCDDSQGKPSPNPFQDLAEGYYWFDSVLYEAYSDCPETLSGDPSFFISATDTEVQDLANFIGTDDNAELLKRILGLEDSMAAASNLCQTLYSSDQQVYSRSITGGAIRTIWELIRSGLNNEVAKYHSSFPGDATEIVKSLGQLFLGEWSGADNREDVIKALFSLAFLEFRRAHELVAKAAARKKKIKEFREQRTRLNHSYLKNDFLSIFGPFRSPPYDVDGMSEELLGLDCEQDKHNDAINSWNERIKPELLEFFKGDGFGPSINPRESFRALAEDCRKWIKALDRFVAYVWPGFFQLEIDAKKKEAKSFFAAGINLYQALRSLRVELDFFKYFSVRD